ncbi:MAG TPA: branched-chain amino acid ABC transporter permease [Anaeromyxobacter sp.]|nr:branched-chain amino acid ABC transporter permease [Anaeromyxobacter sp.]
MPAPAGRGETGMILFLQSLLSGVLMGGVYALVGIGLTLVFGVMRIVNFAHGELVMLGMYLAWFLFTRLGWDPYLSLVVVAPALFLWGALLQAAVVGRALHALPENQMLLTIGLGLAMSNAAMLAFTADYRILTTSYSSSGLQVLGLSVSEPMLAAFLVAVGVTAGLYLFLLRTDTGRAIRATAQDREAAQLMGIDVRRMSLVAFGLGAALAGTAGALVSPTYYIYPQVGGAFTLKAFVIVVLGGMGSVVGATLGGLLVGVTESLAAVYVASDLKELVVYSLFLLVLVARPSGLLGKARA